MISSAIVLGAGSWGTALAALLAQRGLQVQFWGRDPEFMHEMAATRENARYLPGIRLPDSIEMRHDLAALTPAELVLFVTPSKAIRPVAEQLSAAGSLAAGATILSCTKGIELSTGERMSQILSGIFPDHLHAALSGPNHAEEIARQMPSAAVIACEDEERARELQDVFTLPWFRTYTSTDVAGVEWAGAMKNVYAIASGIAKGLQLGDNAIAALVTRGLAEMVRLGTAHGGRPETFSGLSGVGDLVATCYSEHSRNYRLGKLLGEGKPLQEILASTRMIAEGVPNTESLWNSARKADARTPLLNEVYQILYASRSPREALRELFGREPRAEAD